jgi:hypothetical protein
MVSEQMRLPTVGSASANVGVGVGNPAQTPGGTVPAFGLQVEQITWSRLMLCRSSDQTSTYAPEFGRSLEGQILDSNVLAQTSSAGPFLSTSATTSSMRTIGY